MGTKLELGKGRPIDHQDLFQHLRKTWTLARVGSSPDSWIHGKSYIQFDMTMDGTRKKRYCIVQLASDDLFNIEVGRIKRNSEWITGYTNEDGIQADELVCAIEHAYRRTFEN